MSVALLLAGCSDVVAIDFPPTDLSAGTELIALENRAFAVELGALWRPSEPLPPGDVSIAALLYSGSLAENSLTAGPLAAIAPFGPPRAHAGAFVLSIIDGAPGAWRTVQEVPAALTEYQLRDEVISLAEGSAQQHSCVLISGGRLSCWGSNHRGQIGAETLFSLRPLPVAGLSDVVELSIGFNHTCARRSDGRVFCFGHNFFAQLGQNTVSSKEPIPLEVPGISSVTQLSAGGNRTCVLSAGVVTCWGRFGEIESSPLGPTPMNFPTNISRISVGTFAVCGISDGEVYCAGYSGQQGIVGGFCAAGNFVDVAQRIDLPGSAVDVSLGSGAACALLDSGDLYCWGCNTLGQLGVARACPVPVENCTEEKAPELVLGGIASVDLGEQFGCARRTDDAVVCWGLNDGGQIGDGSPAAVEYFLPTLVRELGAVSEVRAYKFHACAREKTGRVLCWGAGGEGRLGDGDDSDRSVPAAVAF